jgi:acyl-[acyl carrier protein]--UDP-N-acetylglucosamine O-acyltransferase
MALIHPTALVSSKAELEDDVVVGPFCIVHDRVRIGSGTLLSAFVTVLDFVKTEKTAVLNRCGPRRRAQIMRSMERSPGFA